MKKYLIANVGCDDTTYTEIELDDKELEILIRFARANNEKSDYYCQPIIQIYEDYEKTGGVFNTGFRNSDNIWIEFKDLAEEL